MQTYNKLFGNLTAAMAIVAEAAEIEEEKEMGLTGKKKRRRRREMDNELFIKT